MFINLFITITKNQSYMLNFIHLKTWLIIADRKNTEIPKHKKDVKPASK